MGNGDGTLSQALTTVSAALLVVGLVVSATLLVFAGEIIATFVVAGVLPALLGYAGLSRAGALPWRTGATGNDEDLVEELKRRYAEGELDEAEMERKVETLLAADQRSSASRRGRGERTRDRAYERS